MMPLGLMDEGVDLQILKINEKGQSMAFLERLGFVSGSKIKIIQKINGNIIVNIKDTRIAINEDIAKKIIVKEIV
ncbi:MAG: FeoA family protein [Erysipelotrichaceae bacterium]|jgi:ferrous iron transport protein A|nr:ferrous iron transport protein A [Erysipelotrichaceae bacterium]HCY05799.1 ferrous iron transport protein A [Erysipelotrichaceae bacterium]